VGSDIIEAEEYSYDLRNISLFVREMFSSSNGDSSNLIVTYEDVLAVSELVEEI